MNRLAPLIASDTSADEYGLLDAASFSFAADESPTTEGDVPFATFAPIHYETGYAYPLVVWLHGAHGSERQLRRVMPHLSMRNAVGVAPRGIVGEEWDAPEATPKRYTWEQTATGIDLAEARVLAAIESAQQQFNIHPERIFLAGYGPGGTMAARLAWNHPQLFAGVATFMGAVPSTKCPLRRVNELRGLPLLLASGLESQAYDEASLCRDLRLLHSAGFTVVLRQYLCGDELMTDMLSDLNSWMMEIVCGSTAQVPS